MVKAKKSDSGCSRLDSARTAPKRFKGIRMRSWGRWVSEIRLPNSRARLWLGSYSTAEAAARAYDVALVCFRGASATLNFPDSPPQIAYGALSHKAIQELAAASATAANCTESSFVGGSIPGRDGSSAQFNSLLRECREGNNGHGDSSTPSECVSGPEPRQSVSSVCNSFERISEDWGTTSDADLTSQDLQHQDWDISSFYLHDTLVFDQHEFGTFTYPWEQEPSFWESSNVDPIASEDRVDEDSTAFIEPYLWS